MSSTRLRRGRRIVAALMLLSMSGAAYGWLVNLHSKQNHADRAFTEAERNGVAYIQPLTQLAAELAKAGLTLAGGQTPDYTNLANLTSQVQQADTSLGSQLATTTRWVALRQKLDNIVGPRLSGVTGANAVGEALTLTVDLARKAGDTSNLILDPVLDTYYLMDATLLRLPKLVLNTTVLVQESKGVDVALSVAVLRYEIAALGDDITSSLRKSMDFTSRKDLGRNLTASLDEFRVALNALAPPAALRPRLSVVDREALAEAASQMIQASVALDRVALAELDALLLERLNAYTLADSQTIATAAAGIALLVVLLWFATPPVVRAPEPDVEPGSQGEPELLEERQPTMQPEDLLAAEELIHVGRGVRVGGQKQATDAW
jgi:sigma-B regulation protein RsbU (phosphoserine phosphatase)